MLHVIMNVSVSSVVCVVEYVLWYMLSFLTVTETLLQALQCLEEALAICEAQLYNFQSLLDVMDVSSSDGSHRYPRDFVIVVVVAKFVVTAAAVIVNIFVIIIIVITIVNTIVITIGDNNHG